MFRKLLVSRRDVPDTRESPLSARRLLVPLFACLLWLASVLLFWGPLRQWVSLSLNDERYSHIILMPVIGAAVMFLERRKVFARSAFNIRAGLPLLLGSLALYWLVALPAVHLDENYTLSAEVFTILLVWVSGFALCCGVEALAAARFPLLLLLLMVPIPFDAMDKIISVLQSGSAEATYALFKLAGIPMFREGVQFELPGIGIEVAKECSSVHSAWALFITGLLLAHMFLKSIWTKTCLSVLTVPIAVFTNAVRIETLWFLATRVDPGFLFGKLHHRGGILFSLISLSILVGFLCILRKLEGHGHRGRGAGEGQSGLATLAGGRPPTALSATGKAE